LAAVIDVARGIALAAIGVDFRGVVVVAVFERARAPRLALTVDALGRAVRHGIARLVAAAAMHDVDVGIDAGAAALGGDAAIADAHRDA
jgi:hypothetical protein